MAYLGGVVLPLGHQAQGHVLGRYQLEAKAAEELHYVVLADEMNGAVVPLQELADDAPANAGIPGFRRYSDTGQFDAIGIGLEPAAAQDNPSIILSH